MRRNAPLLAALAGLSLVHCDSGVIIDVQLRGRPETATTVVVSAKLDDLAAVGTSQTLSRASDRFRVQVQSERSGLLSLSISGQNASSCEEAIGVGGVQVAGPGRYPLEVEMRPEQGCRVQVETIGSVAGRVVASRPGLDCGVACSLGLQLGDVVGLVATTSERFGGWFTDDSQPGCVGRLSCAITVGSGVTKVRANFIPRDSCTPSAWCIEQGVPASAESLYAIWGSSRDDVWIVGDHGMMLHGDGITWQQQPAVTNRALRGVWGTGSRNVWAVGESGTILHYGSGGWTQTPQMTKAWLNGIWGASERDVWAVGDNGKILHWDGASWQAQAAPTTQSLRAVWGSGVFDVWAVGDAGTVLRWGGATWDPIAGASAATALYGVWGSGPRNLWIVGDSGTLVHWTGAPPLMPEQVVGLGGLHGVWGLHERQVWAVGDGGVMLSFDGVAWSALANRPSTSNLNALWGSGLLDVWAPGRAGLLLRYRP